MAGGDDRRRVVIMGAAGRDFHNFNLAFREDAAVEVVAFTAAQIPGIGGRRYPPALSGSLYPDGIPVEDEAELDSLVRARAVDEVVFAYSDVPNETVMHAASRALAAGADFSVLGPRRTMLDSGRPVIAVSAVRTGCGKSQVSRYLSRLLHGRGLRVAVLRHPMPYGDLAAQAVQRFAETGDMDAARCTVEEREEYEPHIAAGNVVFAGVDYARILERAESESDLVLWDGGNNDFPFLRPGLHIVLVDALRPGQAATHHPGEACLRMADVVVIAKSDAAAPDDVARAQEIARALAPKAVQVLGASPAAADAPERLKGRRVLVVEDGPTITHGGMSHGAGFAAARAAGAAEIVDPRPFAPPALKEMFDAHPHIGAVLPALGYSADQLAALERTIADSDAEAVAVATPVDLARLISIEKPVVRVRYDYAEAGAPTLESVVAGWLDRLGSQGKG